MIVEDKIKIKEETIMIRTTNKLELKVMKYNPTSILKLEDQVGRKILQAY